jgi:hypothetical protein
MSTLDLPTEDTTHTCPLTFFFKALVYVCLLNISTFYFLYEQLVSREQSCERHLPSFYLVRDHDDGTMPYPGHVQLLTGGALLGGSQAAILESTYLPY